MTALPTPEQRHREGVERRYGHRPKCDLRHRGPCHGRLQADHVIERQRLKQHLKRAAFDFMPLKCIACGGEGGHEGDTCPSCHGSGIASLDDLIADARNGWLLCESHHSLKWQLEVRRDELPPSVEAFAVDYRLEWSLDRDFAGRR